MRLPASCCPPPPRLAPSRIHRHPNGLAPQCVNQWVSESPATPLAAAALDTPLSSVAAAALDTTPLSSVAVNAVAIASAVSVRSSAHRRPALGCHRLRRTPSTARRRRAPPRLLLPAATAPRTFPHPPPPQWTRASVCESVGK